MQTIGIVGLGNMGAAMARALLRAGFAVQGVDPAAGAIAVQNGSKVRMLPRPVDLCQDCRVILLSLPNAQLVEQVVSGPGGLLSAGTVDLVVIDTTTSHPETTKTVAGLLAANGISMIDAPVSGGPAGAENGSLAIVLGGDPDVIASVTPVLDAISVIRTHVGGIGAGHATKIINNALCAANILLAAEAVRLGRSFGLEASDLIAGLNSGSGRSAATEINFPRWILSDRYDSGFTMKLMRKDVRLAISLMEHAGLDLQLLSGSAAQWTASEGELADGEDFNRIATLILEQES